MGVPNRNYELKNKEFTFIWLNILKFTELIKMQFLSSKIFVLRLHHSPMLTTTQRTQMS